MALALVAAAARPADAIEYQFSVGKFDTEVSVANAPWEAGFAVRLDRVEIVSFSWGTLMPELGVMANEDEAFVGWAGFAFEIPLGRRFRLVPMAGAAAYERGDSRNLGGTFQFRTGLEASVKPSERTAVGLQFYHLSNAGLHEPNPGSNSLVLSFGLKR